MPFLRTCLQNVRRHMHVDHRGRPPFVGLESCARRPTAHSDSSVTATIHRGDVRHATFSTRRLPRGRRAALAAGNASARSSRTSIFFGDSLTDAGSYKPVLPPGTGLFTTNPGPVWAQVLAQRYGLTPIPVEPGRHRLRAGRRARDGASGRAGDAADGHRDVRSRRRSRSCSQAVRSIRNALYAVWGGANDIFFQLGALQAGVITPAQVQANVGTAAGDLVRQVGDPAGRRRADTSSS